jgi:hypothetical protein
MVLSDTIGPGDRVTADASDGELQFEVDAGGARESEAVSE